MLGLNQSSTIPALSLHSLGMSLIEKVKQICSGKIVEDEFKSNLARNLDEDSPKLGCYMRKVHSKTYRK